MRQQEAPDDAANPNIAVPPGMGHYCSMLWRGDRWALEWEPSSKSDPCGRLRDQQAEGRVAHAGLYSTHGLNNVVMRCRNGVDYWRGVGAGPLKSAVDEALASQRRGCVFTVAPDALPLFDSPFSASTRIQGHFPGGFDFAQGDVTVDVNGFDQPGLANAHIVESHGIDMSNTVAVNDHDGHDWTVPTGTPVLSVADGVVLLARDRKVPCESPIQKEVYIQHIVGSGEYEERFVTYYAHVDSYSVVAGQRVKKGQVIGLSGETGCAGGPHLHLAVTRLTNTASEYRRAYSIPSTDHPPMTSNIEPYGWEAPRGFDPWGWMNYPSGALSIDLWNPGQAPAR
ncbi:M23 peptidase domain-containing protein [Myxococcus stipitatus DSM 14675]|uniref:M23 peptidase domain-containing protein n=1 Tax=Myxococcus stipitatus (strain DSM 14675 / JCM 12634 / Mx s8) TaxID=1278073 RepID=L7UKW9_MYXSD|nr:M23 family metallopeptidase [Myxococcus stipitatus]AGC47089.1 M23 peptidase domain-containing protein [Myxococcus stipitatus DSM 14675]